MKLQASLFRPKWCVFAVRAACCLSFVAFGSAAWGATINWGIEFGSKLVYSDGVTEPDAGFTFELGAFATGFEPLASNVAQWRSHWTTLDVAAYNPNLNYVSSTWTVTNGPGAAPGTLVFVWGYNGTDLGVPQEWVLFSNTAGDAVADDWLLPTVSGSQQSLPLNWRTSNAGTVPYGGLKNQQGPGGYTPPPTSFTLQTHLTPVIPEPAVPLLLTAALWLGAGRRRQITPAV